MRAEILVLAKYVADRVRRARGRVVTIIVRHVSPTAETRGYISYVVRRLTQCGEAEKVAPGKYVLREGSEIWRRAKKGDILGIIRLIYACLFSKRNLPHLPVAQI